MGEGPGAAQGLVLRRWIGAAHYQKSLKNTVGENQRLMTNVPMQKSDTAPALD